MLLPEVLDQSGVSGVRLITLLGTALIGIGVARASYDRGIRGRALESAMFETIRRTRLWGLDYKATAAAWSRWAERWSAARVKNGLEATLAADRALKSTTISDDVGILTDLVMQLAILHQEAA